jgi:magnesium transporter
MINPLFIPEIREMLSEHDTAGLKEFCEALHPARTADFMEGLTPEEAWQVLSHTDEERRLEVFHYFDEDMQVGVVESLSRADSAALISDLAHDDRVDILNEVQPEIVGELLPLLPSEERRDILHLQSYPEGTAGAVMTTDVAKFSELLTVAEALGKLQEIASELETIYYLYIVDDQDHLRGLVSARQMLSAIGKKEVRLGELMETGLVTALVDDDQEEVAQKVARYNLLAIPVVNEEHTMKGIITYDDIFDVVQEEATEDAHLSAGVQPLEETYLKTGLMTLVWKRGIWLTILFFAALLTCLALQYYEGELEDWKWLVLFIPLVISSGGNTGNQSATLVIRDLATEELELTDWSRVAMRELVTGLILGGILAMCGLVAACAITPEARSSFGAVWVLPCTLLAVVVCGSTVGAMLPLIFKKMGLDPALMSNPFVAVIIDVVGILIYMNVAFLFLT